MFILRKLQDLNTHKDFMPIDNDNKYIAHYRIENYVPVVSFYIANILPLRKNHGIKLTPKCTHTLPSFKAVAVTIDFDLPKDCLRHYFTVSECISHYMIQSKRMRVCSEENILWHSIHPSPSIGIRRGYFLLT